MFALVALSRDQTQGTQGKHTCTCQPHPQRGESCQGTLLFEAEKTAFQLIFARPRRGPLLFRTNFLIELVRGRKERLSQVCWALPS
jgi:hypothetical protein